MKKSIPIFVAVLFTVTQLCAQLEPTAGAWKTWFITSGREYRLVVPAPNKDEIAEVLSAQKNLDATSMQQIVFWNTGAPSYRWQDIMFKLWTVDTGRYGALANMLLGTATYDATIAAWDTKYAYKRPRPYAADSRTKIFTVKPERPAFTCEHSVAAWVDVAINAHL